MKTNTLKLDCRTNDQTLYQKFKSNYISKKILCKLNIKNGPISGKLPDIRPNPKLKIKHLYNQDPIQLFVFIQFITN